MTDNRQPATDLLPMPVCISGRCPHCGAHEGITYVAPPGVELAEDEVYCRVCTKTSLDGTAVIARIRVNALVKALLVVGGAVLLAAVVVAVWG